MESLPGTAVGAAVGVVLPVNSEQPNRPNSIATVMKIDKIGDLVMADSLYYRETLRMFLLNHWLTASRVAQSGLRMTLARLIFSSTPMDFQATNRLPCTLASMTETLALVGRKP